MSITPQMLLAILGNPIAYHRIYATITGSVTSAVMLSQAMYWTPRSSDPLGWFYKTADEWQEETGLSRREQETARRILKDLQILEEKKQGLPCKLFFRVNLETLYSLIVESANQDPTKGKSKNGGKCQTGMHSFAIQDDTEVPSNLYTEITSEITTEIKFPCNFDLIPEQKTDPLSDLSKPEDPKNPPLPPLAASPRNYAQEMSDRFSNKSNRFAPKGLDLQGFANWHLGGKRNNWDLDLIAVAKVHLKKHEKPFGDGDAINFINAICMREDWAKFELFADEATVRRQKEQSQQQRSQQQPTPQLAQPEDNAVYTVPSFVKDFAKSRKVS